MSGKRTETLMVRVTPTEKAKAAEAAEATGETLSGWVRRIILTAARRGE